MIKALLLICVGLFFCSCSTPGVRLGNGAWQMQTNSVFEKQDIPIVLPIKGDLGELKTGLDNWDCKFQKTSQIDENRKTEQMNIYCESKFEGYKLATAAMCWINNKKEITTKEGGFGLSDSKGKNLRMIVVSCK